MRAVVILISLCLATQAAAQQPLPKRGPCPSGYWSSGDYCVGDRRDAKPAVANPKGGPCPSGWMRSGGACVKYY